ncbi:MAG: MOSC N-terminal beta barrel domain-containing protein [Bacteroidota bacterium]
MVLTEIYIYPVKSLAGISLAEAAVSDRGLINDRRWMIVDPRGMFLSQRQIPEMALLQVGLRPDGLRIAHKYKDIAPIDFCAPDADSPEASAQVWNDPCMVHAAPREVNQWLSEALETNCQLVYMPDNSHRKVEEDFMRKGEIVSFADGFPFLIIGESALQHLNDKLPKGVPMNRFRPNFVFSGAPPHAEDEWAHFRMGEIDFYGVKPCSRCQVTTIDQATGEMGKDPLKTLHGYRKKGNKVLFGMNLLHEGNGKIRVGDQIEIVQKQPPIFDGSM